MVAPRLWEWDCLGQTLPVGTDGVSQAPAPAAAIPSRAFPLQKFPLLLFFFFKCVYLFIFLATQVAAETVRQTSRLRWQLPPREQEQTPGKLKGEAFIPEFFRAVLFSFFPHVFLILSRWRGKRHQKAACSLGVVWDLWSLTKMNALCWVVIEYVLWK